MRNVWGVSLIIGLALAGPARAQIENGGFETGDLSGWSVSGNGSVQVLTAGDFGPVEPVEGRFFALVGTGPGDVEGDGLADTATLTSTFFDVPTGGGVLRLSWNFLTAEFTGPAALDRLDTFSIRLLSATGAEIMLESGNVGDEFSLLASGSPVAAPDGTSVLEHMGFRFGTYALAEGSYSIAFSVADVGDGSFDSALAVDALTFRAGTQASVIPESGTLACLAAGLPVITAFASLQRRRRYKRRR